MIFRTPSYYSDFRCIADKCTDNCCIGWEIGIDSDTADYYKSLGGTFGQRLCENISCEDTFILNGERCPFLNENNLCDIIINCGEERLCQICRDHPRFFNWYGNIKEGGIGLSCEEGARLILTTDSVSYKEADSDEEEEPVDEELFSFLLSARESIFAAADRESVSVREILWDVLCYTQKLQFVLDNPHLTQDDFVLCDNEAKEQGSTEKLFRLFGQFEAIDDSWIKELKSLRKKALLTRLDRDGERYVKNIFRYFIYRYFLGGVFDGEILSKVKFAVVSVIFIALMTEGKNDIGTWIEKSKLYSKQMEYSEENRELFYDMSYEKSCFDLHGLKGLIDIL